VLIPHISVINMIGIYGSSNGYMTVGLDDFIVQPSGGESFKRKLRNAWKTLI